MLSTIHNDQGIDQERGDLKKPEIFTFYNQTKLGIDVLNQMCAQYNVSRNSIRWPIINLELINIAPINLAFIGSTILRLFLFKMKISAASLMGTN